VTILFNYIQRYFFHGRLLIKLIERLLSRNDKIAVSIGIEYCLKISEKVSPLPISILHTESIGDTIGSNINTGILTTLPDE